MIPRSSIREFLERPRADYSRWIRMSQQEIRRKLRALPGRPPIWKKLRLEQKICLLAGVKTGRFAFFLDTGIGKTLLSVALIRYFKRYGLGRRYLVLVPNRANVTEWELEILKHSPNTPYCLLKGSNACKLKLLFEEDATIYVTTYAGFARMMAKFGPAPKRRKNKKPMLRKDPKLVKAVAARIDGMFLDESVRVQNHRSLSFKVCRALAPKMKQFFILCATPFNRDPSPLWAQMMLVDGGETFGKTIGLFRAAFFKEKENYFSGFKDWVFDRKREKEVVSLLANRSIRVKADESSLPTVIRIRKEINLGASARELYKAAKARLQESRGSIQEIKNYFILMRQISSGFVGYEDDEFGIRAQTELEPNRKLEMLVSMVEEIAPQHKIVVFCDYTFSGSMICRELEALKIGHGRIYGGTKDPSVIRKRFDSDPKMRVLVLQNSCGGFGLNLQVAKWAIFFESPVSAMMRQQTERRVERQGSKHKKVFIADLVVDGTFDDRILEFHRQGKDLMDALIRGKVKLPSKLAKER